MALKVEQPGITQMMEKNIFADLNLSPAEERLALENQQLRIQLEQVKYLLNKNIDCEQLSLKGSVQLLIDQHNKAQTNIHLLKDEFRKLQVLLSKSDIKECRDFVTQLLNNYSKLYGEK
jgi:hypothetical protein